MRGTAITYLARCTGLERRGLSGDLTEQLRQAGNWTALEDLETCTDEQLAKLSGLHRGLSSTAHALAGEVLAGRLLTDRDPVETTASDLGDVRVFRYYPPEDDCDHAGAKVGRLRVESGLVVGHADVLWCPACNSVVGPAPVEPLLWDGDQA